MVKLTVLFVGMLELDLKLEGCRSLKEKRQVLASLIDRTRRRFQVSISEVDDMDLWQDATIGVALVSNNARQAESVLAKVLEFFEECADLEVISIRKEVSQP